MPKSKKRTTKKNKKATPKAGSTWAKEADNNKVGNNKVGHRGPQGGGPKSNRPTRRPGF